MSVVLGFDFGMKHIGVAVGQTVTHTAKPLSTLSAKDGMPNWEEIDQCIKNWQPKILLVGLPLNMDGSEQAITFAAKKFGNRLQAHTKLPVEFVDERLTSWEAQNRWEESRTQQGKNRILRKNKKQKLHGMSAVILIEQWMNKSSE